MTRDNANRNPSDASEATDAAVRRPTPRNSAVDRSLQAKLAVHTSWANTEDRAARTEAARKAARNRFEALVDPDNKLPAAERARRAEHALKAHMARISRLGAQAKRQKRKSA